MIITSRFRGPPTSGNGGYSCGLVGELVEGPAEVTLRRPPPLDEPLEVESGDTVRLLHAGALVAEGRRAVLDLEVPEPPTFEEATARSEHYVGFQRHPYPTCFVCGPERDPGDGLRIFPGRLEGERLVSAPWVPHASQASPNGKAMRAIIWAALDCPGYFSALSGESALLGRMIAEVLAEPNVGEPCIVIGWKIAIDERKVHAGTALFDSRNKLLGRAKQTWILPKS